MSYRVTVPRKVAGKRLFKQFRALDQAENWAQKQQQGAVKDGQRHFSLSPSQREDAVAALSLLEGLGITLTQAVELAKKNLPAATSNLKVKDAVKALIAEKEAENLRERSIRDLRNRLDTFALGFGEKLVSEITSDEIKQWLRDLHGIVDGRLQDLSARTKKNYLISVRTFFNWALNNGHRAAANPASFKSPKADWEIPSILTVEEATRLLKAAQVQQKGELLGAVVFGLFAGVRSTELMKLNWEDLNLQEGLLTIRPEIAKKRRIRNIDLTPNCIAWINAVARREGKIAPGGYTVRWAKFVKAAGFPDWGKNRSNAMRHSFGSYHFALGGDAAKTSSAMGHRSGDQVLFDSYRSLVTRKDAEAYFAILPQ